MFSFIDEIRNNGEKRKRMLMMLALVAVLVAGAVFWILRIKGITMVDEAGCGIEEHTHTEACIEKRLICGFEESDEHTHTDACYEITYTCGKVEHTHTKLCYPDPNADVETVADWENTLPLSSNLNGDWGEDTVAVAVSQLGYTESERNYILGDNNEHKGYTRYGAWYGNDYGDWDAMFVAFCTNYAGIPRDALPVNAGAESLRIAYQDAGILMDKNYSPAVGDIVFFDTDKDSKADSVGIVVTTEQAALADLIGDIVIDTETRTEETAVTEAAVNTEVPSEFPTLESKTDKVLVLRTIEGNADNAVSERKYVLESAPVLGYASMKLAREEYASRPIETETPNETEPTLTEEATELPEQSEEPENSEEPDPDKEHEAFTGASDLIEKFKAHLLGNETYFKWMIDHGYAVPVREPNRATRVTESGTKDASNNSVVNVDAEWNDDDHDGVIITATLYKDGVNTNRTVELNSSNGWHNAFTGLEDGSTYTVSYAYSYTSEYLLEHSGASVEDDYIIDDSGNEVFNDVWVNAEEVASEDAANGIYDGEVYALVINIPDTNGADHYYCISTNGAMSTWCQIADTENGVRWGETGADGVPTPVKVPENAQWNAEYIYQEYDGENYWFGDFALGNIKFSGRYFSILDDEGSPTGFSFGPGESTGAVSLNYNIGEKLLYADTPVYHVFLPTYANRQDLATKYDFIAKGIEPSDEAIAYTRYFEAYEWLDMTDEFDPADPELHIDEITAELMAEAEFYYTSDDIENGGMAYLGLELPEMNDYYDALKAIYDIFLYSLGDPYTFEEYMQYRAEQNELYYINGISYNGNSNYLDVTMFVKTQSQTSTTDCTVKMNKIKNIELTSPQLSHKKSIDYLGDSDPNPDVADANKDDFYRVYLELSGVQEPVDLIVAIDRATIHTQNGTTYDSMPQIREFLNGNGDDEKGLIKEFLSANDNNRLAVVTYSAIGGQIRDPEPTSEELAEAAYLHNTSVRLPVGGWGRYSRPLLISETQSISCGYSDLTSGLLRIGDLIEAARPTGHKIVVLILSSAEPAVAVENRQLTYEDVWPVNIWGIGECSRTVSAATYDAIYAFKQEYSDVIVKTATFENIDTDYMKALSQGSDSAFYNVYEDGLAGLKNDLNMLPSGMVVNDELSEFVELYNNIGANGNLKITRRNRAESQRQAEDITNDSSIQTHSVSTVGSGDNARTKISVTFNDDFRFDSNYIYTISYDIKVKPDVEYGSVSGAATGENPTDYIFLDGETVYINTTSSLRTGFNCDEKRATLSYDFLGNYYREEFLRPVVQKTHTASDFEPGGSFSGIGGYASVVDFEYDKYIDSLKYDETNPDTDVHNMSKNETDYYRLYLDFSAHADEGTDLLIIVDRSISMIKNADESGTYHPVTTSISSLTDDKDVSVYTERDPITGRIVWNPDSRVAHVENMLNGDSNGNNGVIPSFLSANSKNRVAVMSFGGNNFAFTSIRNTGENALHWETVSPSTLSSTALQPLEYVYRLKYTDGSTTYYLSDTTDQSTYVPSFPPNREYYLNYTTNGNSSGALFRLGSIAERSGSGYVNPSGKFTIYSNMRYSISDSEAPFYVRVVGGNNFNLASDSPGLWDFQIDANGRLYANSSRGYSLGQTYYLGKRNTANRVQVTNNANAAARFTVERARYNYSIEDDCSYDVEWSNKADFTESGDVFKYYEIPMRPYSTKYDYDDTYDCTNYAAALEMAKQIFAQSMANGNSRKELLFISDGEPSMWLKIDSQGNIVTEDNRGNSASIESGGHYVKMGNGYTGSYSDDYPNGEYNILIAEQETEKAVDIFNNYMNDLTDGNYTATSVMWSTIGNLDRPAIRNIATDSSRFLYLLEDDVSDLFANSGGTALQPNQVTITDALSKYVRFLGDTNYYPNADRGEIIVKRVAKDGSEPDRILYQNGNKIDYPGEPDNRGGSYYIQRVFYTSGDFSERPEASTGTITVELNDGIEFETKYKFVVSFNVELTRTAREEWAKSGYNAVGDDDTDLVYTSPSGVENSITSSGCDGFRSNDHAEVTMIYGSNPLTLVYDHPVVQTSGIVETNYEHKKTLDYLGDNKQNASDTDRTDANNPDTDLDDGNDDCKDLYRLYLDIEGTPTEAFDILFVLDCTETMFNTPYTVQGLDNRLITRMTAAESRINDIGRQFLKLNPYSRVAVIGFGGEANDNTANCTRLIRDWTDYEHIYGTETIYQNDDIIAYYNAPSNMGRVRNYAAALERAQQVFSRSTNLNKILVFISDGVPGAYITVSGALGNGDTVQGTKDYIDAFVDSHKLVDNTGDYRINISSIAFGTGFDTTLLDYLASTAADNIVLNDRDYQAGANYNVSGAVSFKASDESQLGKAIQKSIFPAGLRIRDELSKYVRFYTTQPDIVVTVDYYDEDGNYIESRELYHDGITMDGVGKINKVTYEELDGATAPTGSTGTVILYFNEDYVLEPGAVYTLSFNVKTTKTAYDEYAANGESDHYAGVEGDEDTDYNTNETSSLKPGFHSNTSAEVNYYLGNSSMDDKYRHPVIQVDNEPPEEEETAEASIVVYKNWADGNENHSGDEISVTLYANGHSTGKKATLSASSSPAWTYIFTGLPAYDSDGALIEYSVVEDVFDGYTVSYSYAISVIYKDRLGNVLSVTGPFAKNTVSSVTAPDLDPHDENFKGWSLDLEGSGTLIQPGDTIDITPYNSNLVLYAQYYGFNVYYHATEDSSSSAVRDDRGPFQEGEEVSFKTFAQTGITMPAGKNFRYWTVDGVEQSSVTIEHSDIHVYPHYIDTYQVVYNGGYDEVENVPTDPNSPYDADGTVTVLDAGSMYRPFTYINESGNSVTNNTWWAFDGWVENGTHYTAGQQLPIGTGHSFTAQWTDYRPRYSVTYDLNNGPGSAPANITNILIGDSANVSVGYGMTTSASADFLGWKDSETGTVYANGDTIPHVTRNITLVAQWHWNKAWVNVSSPQAGHTYLIIAGGKMLMHTAANTTTMASAVPTYDANGRIVGINGDVDASVLAENAWSFETYNTSYFKIKDIDSKYLYGTTSSLTLTDNPSSINNAVWQYTSNKLNPLFFGNIYFMISNSNGISVGRTGSTVTFYEYLTISGTGSVNPAEPTRSSMLDSITANCAPESAPVSGKKQLLTVNIGGSIYAVANDTNANGNVRLLPVTIDGDTLTIADPGARLSKYLFVAETGLDTVSFRNSSGNYLAVDPADSSKVIFSASEYGWTVNADNTVADDNANKLHYAGSDENLILSNAASADPAPVFGFYTITPNADQSYSIIVTNTPWTKTLTLEKRDTMTVGELLDGAVFELYETNDVWSEPAINAVPIMTQTSGEREHGVVIFEGLTYGNYLLYEAQVPDGYSANSHNDKYWKVMVRENGITVTDMHDFPVSLNGTTPVIANYPIVVLPKTGSTGEVAYFIGGAVALIASVIGATVALKRRKREQKPSRERI